MSLVALEVTNLRDEAMASSLSPCLVGRRLQLTRKRA